MVPQEAIARAGRILARAARSPAKVVVFGSYARGDAGPDSDLDFLVIEHEVDSRLEEMVRLRDALPPLGVPVDVIVVSRQHAADWAGVPNTVVHVALEQGRVVAES